MAEYRYLTVGGALHIEPGPAPTGSKRGRTQLQHSPQPENANGHTLPSFTPGTSQQLEQARAALRTHHCPPHPVLPAPTTGRPIPALASLSPIEFSTGIPEFDAVCSGGNGLVAGTVTEVCGPPHSGKTYVCLHAAAAALVDRVLLRPAEFQGFEGIVWVTTDSRKHAVVEALMHFLREFIAGLDDEETELFTQQAERHRSESCEPPSHGGAVTNLALGLEQEATVLRSVERCLRYCQVHVASSVSDLAQIADHYRHISSTRLMAAESQEGEGEGRGEGEGVRVGVRVRVGVGVGSVGSQDAHQQRQAKSQPHQLVIVDCLSALFTDPACDVGSMASTGTSSGYAASSGGGVSSASGGGTAWRVHLAYMEVRSKLLQWAEGNLQSEEEGEGCRHTQVAVLTTTWSGKSTLPMGHSTSSYAFFPHTQGTEAVGLAPEGGNACYRQLGGAAAQTLSHTLVYISSRAKHKVATSRVPDGDDEEPDQTPGWGDPAASVASLVTQFIRVKGGPRLQVTVKP